MTHAPHPATTGFCEPDLRGFAGDAWLVDLPLVRNRPDEQAALASWQATIPGAHPLWHSYSISVVHLHPIDGAPPAVKTYPQASHELTILALDPATPLSNPKDGARYRTRYLVPVNLSLQFHGVSDGQAQGLARALTTEFVSGRMNPDTDFRSLTIAFVKQYLQRFGGGLES